MIAPSKPFGSGTASVASEPVISTNPPRDSGESKLKMLCDDCPDSNFAIALTCVGTVTSKSVPASGPDPIVRFSLDFEPIPATAATGPKSWTSVVR